MVGMESVKESVMTMSSTEVLLAVLLLVTSSLFLWWLSKPGLEKGKVLAPGKNWNIPVVGETSLFLKNPHKFLDQKREKYGGVFRVDLFGQTSAILSTPESARFVLVQAYKSFKHGYRPSIIRITDPKRCFMDTTMNSRVRRLLTATLGPENVHGCVPAYDSLTMSVINSWKDGATLNTVKEMETIILKCILHLFWGQQDVQHEYMEILRLHTAMSKGHLAAFPINLPFTDYGKAIKAVKEFKEFLLGRVAEARAAKTRRHDVISMLLEEKMEDGSNLTDEQIHSVITTLVFAGYRTTSTTLVWIFKFLHENPNVFADIKEEQWAIKNSKRSTGDALTWEDIKKMTLTQKALKETLRLAPAVKFMSRVALEEVEYGGYTIPKGWRTYASYQFHFDPTLYPDPYKFDPSRFDEAPKPNTFIPFGSGRHLCVGYEFTNTVIPLVVHRVITNFSYKHVGPDGVLFWPHYIPKDGYPLKINRLSA